MRRSEELSFGNVRAGEQAHGKLGFKRLRNGKRGYLSRHFFPIFEADQLLGVLPRFGAQIITQEFNFAFDRENQSAVLSGVPPPLPFCPRAETSGDWY